MDVLSVSASEARKSLQNEVPLDALGPQVPMKNEGLRPYRIWVVTLKKEGFCGSHGGCVKNPRVLW